MPEARRRGTPPTKVRVLIVDDDARIRRGLREMIRLSRDLVVVGEAASAKRALELDLALRPDVVVIDVLLPRARDGLGVVTALTARGRATIAISVSHDLEVGAIAAGAGAFFGKGSELLERLVPALHAATAKPRG